MSVAQIKRRIDGLTPQTLCHQKEGVIDRSHHHHPVAGLGEALQRERLPADNTGDKSQHLTGDLPPVTAAEPATNGSVPLLAGERIAQHFVLQPFPQGIHHKRRGAEVHIRHPHGKEVVTPPHILHAVPLHGVGVTAVNHFIKIIFHIFMLLKELSKVRRSYIGNHINTAASHTA